MTLLRVSLSYLRAAKPGTVLNVLLFAFGVAIVTLLLLTSAQLGERMHRDARGIDLVVSAKGSAMQIVLSSVYQLDAPTGNIAWSRLEELARNPGVKKAIPLVLADNYQGFRIAGTTHDYVTHYDAMLREGRLWQAEGEAVLGAEAARKTGLKPGSTLAAVHGLRATGEHIHAVHPYRVVGVLARTGTVIDRLVLTDLASVWALHPHENNAEENPLVTEPPPADPREVTAILVQYASAATGATLADEVNANSEMQAASPADETSRLFSIMAVGMAVLRAFAAVLVFAAGLSLFIALYGALSERRYDLAIMGALGASPTDLMMLLLLEGLLLAAIGIALGLAFGHILTSAIGFALRHQQVGVTGWAWNENEIWIVAAALAVGAIAALLPAWRAHETDIARTLTR